MRYAFATLIYWPIWLGFRVHGYSYFGMFLGGLTVLSMWSILSKVQFGTWRFWMQYEID